MKNFKKYRLHDSLNQYHFKAFFEAETVANFQHVVFFTNSSFFIEQASHPFRAHSRQPQAVSVSSLRSCPRIPDEVESVRAHEQAHQ